MPQKQPNFLLIGAQKCGTTWLFQHLRQHPEIFMSPVKDEGHYFWTASREDARQSAYLDQFAPAGDQHRAIGEATTIYFWTRTESAWDFHPAGAEYSVPARIKGELGGKLKILLCLRDPVDRALSAFIHYARAGEIDIDQPILSCGGHNGIIEMGFYARHLAAWQEHFNLQQFLILNFEQDIRVRPEQTLHRVFDFLGIEPDHTPRNARKSVFPGLSRTWRDQSLFVTDAQGTEHRIADLQTVGELQNIYRADVDDLGRILGHGFLKVWRTVNSIL